MKMYYRKGWSGRKVFVGYKVSSLVELANEGYWIYKSSREEFLKCKIKGVVYLNTECNFLMFKDKYIIPVYSREAFISDHFDGEDSWEQYVQDLNLWQRSVLKNGSISR